MRLPSWISQHLAGLRALLALTVLTGIAYPLVVTGVAQLPGLRGNANGSLVTAGGRTVGSGIIGQSFTDKNGKPLVQYFQSRPSAGGYDPTASGASNLGPESVVDAPGAPSLLTQVCTRSKAIGTLEHVSGARPYCTASGVGAVLAVFRTGGATGRITRVVSVNQQCPATPFIRTYRGVRVECARRGADYAKGVITPVRGTAPAHPAVPADAVTASGSGLDPDISVAYADLQAPRIHRVRDIPLATVRHLIEKYTTGRALGFMGQPAVDVLKLNIELDQRYPYRG
jgi:potassium-transporting ATPase KdpC subunit